MNLHALARRYDHLTPEERARLIVAAGARGDEAEQKRLLAAGKRITLSMRDHAPFAQALNELATMVFLQSLEAVAEYRNAFALLNEFEDAERAATEDEPEDDEGQDSESTSSASIREADAAGSEQSGWEHCFGLVLAQGFALKTWADGWKRFCGRLGIPPLPLWQHLPGFERLQRALAVAERAAFAPEGMIRWLNDNRRQGAPEIEELSLAPEGIAEELEACFREQVAWWGG